MNRISNFKRLGALMALALSASMTGCYVVPISSDGRTYPLVAPHTPSSGHALVIPAPGPSLVNVRMYPANDAAASLGVVNAQVMNLLDGRGQFQATIGPEVYSGEATRAPRSQSGTASASGNRGGYLSCSYTMTNAALGTGTCSLSSGAQFRMHLGG